MDNLYTLLRSADNNRTPPLTLKEATDLLNRKKAYFLEEAKTNPLAREILRGGRIGCDGLTKSGDNDFFAGPATFFRVHELLRKTRSQNLPFQIGNAEFPHNEVVDLFERCVPNVHLHYAPWCSPARYTASLGLAWGSTLLVAHLVARNADSRTFLDPDVLYHMGLYTTLAALLYTALKKNRDVRHSAPWNTAIYLDLNTDLIRRDLPAAALARKEFLPRQHGLFKTPDFYYPLARKIENHGFDTELSVLLAGQKTAAPTAQAQKN
jgi:hypothetical protein